MLHYGHLADTGAVVVRIDPRYFRPAEVETLLGNPTKAREKLGSMENPPTNSGAVAAARKPG